MDAVEKMLAEEHIWKLRNHLNVLAGRIKTNLKEGYFILNYLQSFDSDDLIRVRDLLRVYVELYIQTVGTIFDTAREIKASNEANQKVCQKKKAGR